MFAAVVTLGSIAFILALGLGIASRILAIEVDPRVEEVTRKLPGANCGGCGYAGCAGLAEAVVAGLASPSACKAASPIAIEEIALFLGLVIDQPEKCVARIFCCGSIEAAQPRFIYEGVKDCRAVSLIAGGQKACIYGCLGLGSCVKTCPFQAIQMGKDGLPLINEALCTGCGACVSECPRSIIQLIPVSQSYLIPCRSHQKGKSVREVCKVGCLGCGLCVKNCPQQAITMIEYLPVIDAAKCKGCGICAEKCPQKIILALGSKGKG